MANFRAFAMVEEKSTMSRSEETGWTYLGRIKYMTGGEDMGCGGDALQESPPTSPNIITDFFFLYFSFI